MSGLIFVFRKRFMIFAVTTPEAVPKTKARRPRATISTVCMLRKVFALMVEPIATVSTMVTRLSSVPPAVSERRSTMRTSRNRLPSISIVTSGATGGKNRLTMMAMITGKMIFSTRLTLRSWAIWMFLSALVVSNLMIGGWMIGISAI